MTSPISTTKRIRISKLQLVNFRGERIALSDSTVTSLEIFEDIFVHCMSVKAAILDTNGIVSNFPIIGEETLEVEYRTDEDDDPVNLSFRIYKVAGRTSQDSGRETYMLHGVTPTLLEDSSQRISRSFKDMPVSEMVQAILDDINPDGRESFVDETDGQQSFISPNLHPLEAVSQLLPRARKGDRGTFFFYETVGGFHFKELGTMFKDDSGLLFRQGVKGLSANLANEFNIMEGYQIGIDVDSLNASREGMYGNTVMWIDTMTKDTGKHTYDYNEEYTNEAHAGKLHGKVVSGQNELAKRLNGVVKVVPTTEKRRELGHKDSPLEKENVIHKRVSRIQQLMRTQKISFMVHGDARLEAGKTVELKMRKQYHREGASQEDEIHSGKYLVTAVRHILLPMHKMVVECCRDTYGMDIDNWKRETF